VSYELDAELVPAMAALAARAAEAPALARGDWQAVRTAAAAGLAYMDTLTPAWPPRRPTCPTLLPARTARLCVCWRRCAW
jgi:hypothetical protein